VNIGHLVYEYNTVVSPIHDEIVWIENALLQDGTFCLQGKEVLQHPDCRGYDRTSGKNELEN
jgi:hypothetical protein